MRQALRSGALGRPRGSGWRGRWEGGSGWGTHVNPWLFHFSVWQNSLQIKRKRKKKKNEIHSLTHCTSLGAPGSWWIEVISMVPHTWLPVKFGQWKSFRAGDPWDVDFYSTHHSSIPASPSLESHSSFPSSPASGSPRPLAPLTLLGTHTVTAPQVLHGP